MALSIEKELMVVNFHIETLENVLSEFKAPKEKAELYAELSKANGRRAALEHQLEMFAVKEPQAEELLEENSGAEETSSEDASDDPAEVVAYEEVSADDENESAFEVMEDDVEEAPDYDSPANFSDEELENILAKAREA